MKDTKKKSTVAAFTSVQHSTAPFSRQYYLDILYSEQANLYFVQRKSPNITARLQSAQYVHSIYILNIYFTFISAASLVTCGTFKPLFLYSTGQNPTRKPRLF